MKTFLLFYLLAVCALPLWAGETLLVQDPYGDTRKVGNFEVKQLHSGILPKIILQGKRTVTVQPRVDLEPPFNKLDTHSPALQKGVSYVENLMYSYFLQGWKDWRAAANAWLPASYQLPELTFLRGSSASEHSVPVVLTARFPSFRVNTLGTYNAMADEIQLVFPIHFLKYVSFSGTDAFQRILVEADYKNMICNIIKGNGAYWENLSLPGNTIDDVRWTYRGYAPLEQETACLEELAAVPASQWDKRSVFANSLQRTMTHEWGHFLGFGHIDDSIMSTGGARNLSLLQPNEQDGLRLAVLVCWYHNKRVGKEICFPQIPSVKNRISAPKK